MHADLSPSKFGIRAQGKGQSPICTAAYAFAMLIARNGLLFMDLASMTMAVRPIDTYNFNTFSDSAVLVGDQIFLESVPASRTKKLIEDIPSSTENSLPN
jgi:hypothetical protein